MWRTRNSLLALLIMLVAGMAQAAVLVETRYKTWGSATSANLDHLSIPRHQIGLTGEDGEIVIVSDAYPYGDRMLTFIDDFEESPLTPVVSDQSGTPLVYDHSHLWMKGDTAYLSWVDSSGILQMRAYRANASTISRLFTYNIPYVNTTGGIHVAPVARLGTTDSMVMVTRSRGDEVPSDHNVVYWLSADAGQTWDSIGYALDWTAHTGRIRIGLEPYDGSVALVLDSSDQWVVCAKFNRDGGNGSWTHLGRSANVPSGAYRAFGAGTYNGDTSLVTWLINDDCGSGYTDSCYSSRRSKGTGSWTNMTPFVMSTANYAAPPYTTSSYIEASDRFVIFYSKNTDGNVNNCKIMMRYLDNATGQWSEEYEIDGRTGRGPYSYKLTAPAYVPAAYGDKTYVDFSADSVGGSTTYHLGVLAEVAFTELVDTVAIDTLPWVIRVADSFKVFTFATPLVESDSIGIYFESGAHDIVIDGGNDTLRWGVAGIASDTSNDGGGRGQWGLSFRSAGAYNITLKNIVFDHGLPQNLADSAIFNAWACAIRGGAGVVNLTIQNCDFKVKGRNSKIMYWNGSGANNYNIEIADCIFRDSMHSFYRRDMWDQQSMLALTENNGIDELYSIPFEFHFKIHGCSVVTAFWTNVHLQGDSTVAEIYSNYWQSDGWNLLQNTVPGIYDNCTENYCLAIRQSSAHGVGEGNRIKVYSNTIRSGSAHAGSRGIFISGVDGINYNYADSCVAIFDNDIQTHGGWDGYVAFHDAVRIRDDWSHLRITGNTIKNTGYATPPDSSYSDGPHGVIRLTENTGSHLYMKHNTIIGAMEDAFTFDERNGEDGVGISCIVTDECDNQSEAIHVDSNRFITNNMVFDMGFGNGQGGSFTSLIGNTFEFYEGQSSNNSQQYIWYSGLSWSNTENSFYSYLTDCIYDSSWEETHLYLSDAQSDSLQIGLKSTVVVTVVDGAADPVAGATVTITDAYAHEVASGTTNGAGQFSATLKHYELFNATWGVADSTAFNPFVFHAEYGVDSDDSTYTVASDAKAVTLTLGSVVAPPTPPLLLIRNKMKIKNHVWIGKNRESGAGVVDPEPPQP